MLVGMNIVFFGGCFEPPDHLRWACQIFVCRFALKGDVTTGGTCLYFNDAGSSGKQLGLASSFLEEDKLNNAGPSHPACRAYKKTTAYAMPPFFF